VTPSAAPQLQYAPKPPLRKRRFARRLISGFIALLLLLGLWHWWPHIWLRLQILYWQEQCAEYVMPANQIVFELDSSGQVVSNFTAQPWSEFYSRLSPPGMRSDATLFVRRLRTAGGTKRLVAVSLLSERRSDGEFFLFDIRRFAADSLFGFPREKIDRWNLENALERVGVWRKEGLTLRIHGGQVDPNDASQFRILIERGDEQFTVIGHLHDDGKVHFENAESPFAREAQQEVMVTRPAPATQPSAP
jgi:hypothetical protein